MEKYFATYNQSLALKKLGFDEDCLGRWLAITEWEKPTGEIKLQLGVKAEDYDKNQCLAPLKSQVFDWFRNEHGLNHMIDINFRTNNYITQLWRNRECLFNEHSIKTYEEAESACIDKLIELLQHDK